MKKIILSSLITLVCSNSSVAQKIYKSIDADGNVTFSQVEPIVQENDPIQVETLKVSNTNNAMSTVTTKFGKEQCGDIQLPNNNNSYSSRNKSSTKYLEQKIARSKDNWIESLARLSKQMVKATQNNLKSRSYNRSSSYTMQRNSEYKSRYDANTTKGRDLRCAINWAETKEGVIDDTHEFNQTEKMRLVAISKKLEASINTKCGQEPIYDPSSNLSKKYSRIWKQCSYTSLRDLKNVKRKIEQL